MRRDSEKVESVPRKVRLMTKGHMRVAVAAENGDVLRNAAVRETLTSVRERGH